MKLLGSPPSSLFEPNRHPENITRVVRVRPRLPEERPCKSSTKKRWAAEPGWGAAELAFEGMLGVILFGETPVCCGSCPGPRGADGTMMTDISRHVFDVQTATKPPPSPNNNTQHRAGKAKVRHCPAQSPVVLAAAVPPSECDDVRIPPSECGNVRVRGFRLVGFKVGLRTGG